MENPTPPARAAARPGERSRARDHLMRARVLLRAEVDAGVPDCNSRLDPNRITPADREWLRAIGDDLRWTGARLLIAVRE